jgi:hypothetical protein
MPPGITMNASETSMKWCSREKNVLCVHVRDFHATVLHLLGFDHTRFTVRYQGLDQKLTGVEPARVIRDLLG